MKEALLSRAKVTRAPSSDEEKPPKLVSCSVPQGSVLGPLPFVLYTTDVERIIEAQGLLHHCYTDDTKLYFFISEWMVSTRLKLNPSKSAFLWCTTLRCRCLLDDSTFTFGDTDIRPDDTIRNLGVHFDSCMTRLVHVSQLVRGCFYPRLKPFANSFRPQPPSWSRASLSPWSTTVTAYCGSTGLPARSDTIRSKLRCPSHNYNGRTPSDHRTRNQCSLSSCYCAPL